MKKLIVPKICLTNADEDTIIDAMSALVSQPIDVLNWKEQYSYQPEVYFRIAHDGDHIYLQYNVKEREVLSIAFSDNERVCADSCVEMFVSFDNGQHYYNAEFSCNGVALLGYRKLGEAAVRGSEKIMQSIKRFPTLGLRQKIHQQEDTHWSLILIIPKEAFFGDSILSFDGLEAHANFYKCGDKLQVPHYLSWNEINTPKPSFHQPSFFGKLYFE